MTNAITEIFGEPISVYTRAQAIEDGFLMDVSETAREAGVRFPVALSEAVVAMVQPNEFALSWGQSFKGRLWDVIWMMRCAMRRASESRATFRVILRNNRRSENHPDNLKTLVAHCGPGDDGEPVITIMTPDED